MASDKFTITDKLRFDIVERRKNLGISSYELSERAGHSKFWLQNIESGKTKKISKEDLLSIYMVMEDTDDEADAANLVERVISQSVGESSKRWYELIDISESFSEMYAEDALMEKLDELLDEDIIPKIRDIVFGMSTNQKQAALTALQNFYYSLYKNPELTFALINIPVYGVNAMNSKEYKSALNNLLEISAKYNDFVIKNGTQKTIEDWMQRDLYFEQLNAQTIHIALANFRGILLELMLLKDTENPDIFALMNKFVRDVTFTIERGQPNVTKHYLNSYSIHNGQDFITHIKDCVAWFTAFQNKYGLSNIYDVVSKSILDSVYEYLSYIGEIHPTLE